MLRVGITGGIGSGKTTVCRLFENLGVAVYYADLEAKQLYATDKTLQQQLIDTFGPQVYLSGELNRSWLSAEVFGNAEKLQLLNGIVHPAVFAHYESWCLQHSGQPYTLKEAAILFESGSYKRIHLAIAVVAPDEVRIARTMAREGWKREEVLQRMQKQWPTTQLQACCDFTILNDGVAGLGAQVMEIHHLLLKQANATLPDFKVIPSGIDFQ